MARLLTATNTTNGRLLADTESVGASPSIDTISAAVEQGATGNFTASNFSTIVTWRLTDADGNTIDTTGTATTFDCPALGDGPNLLTGTVTLTLIDDQAAQASDTFTLAVQSGYHEVRLATGFDTGPESFVEGYSQNVEVGDPFFGLDADITLRDDATALTDGPVTTTLYGMDRSDGQMESFTYETGPLYVTSNFDINFESIVYVSANFGIDFESIVYAERNYSIVFGSSSSFTKVSLNYDFGFDTLQQVSNDLTVAFNTSEIISRNYSFTFGSDSLPFSTPAARVFKVT